MRKPNSKIVIVSLILLSVFSCKKYESGEENSAPQSSEKAIASDVSDSVSVVASQTVPDKKFVKTADVNMEVKDVYDATIFIEKQLQNLGGFVTESRLKSNVVSEETFETSDSEATLVKKFQTENTMQVRVPSEKLGEFLTIINDQKLFLNSRIILAEDVTDNAKISELERQKIQKTGEVIGKMKSDADKVEKTEQNLEQNNENEIGKLKLSDDLKYSTIDIYIKEPKLRIAEIPVINSKNIDNKYKFNFLYDLKNAFVEGFYLVQKLLVGIATIWPLVLIGGIVFYSVKIRRKTLVSKNLE